MNNSVAQSFIEQCDNDLEKIENIIDVLGSTNNTVPFLTKYAIIKACGTLEQCFKTIITDFSCSGQNTQTKNYINKTFRESSMNPSLSNIHSSLLKFDDNWHDDFKMLLTADPEGDRIKASIASLNNGRNEFAHGGNPTMAFADVKKYFEDAKKILIHLDTSVK